MKSGKVYLIGAGPGDPGLITVKGMECLQTGDVIVYDRLLDDRLLDATRADAEKIYAGKASSNHTMPQTEINKLLVRKAKEGKTVVRLKGGDPFVFGRGGEEAQELAKNNIDFEIVPGITSAIAVPAYAGIPVTHRTVASSFAVITGHEDPTKPDSSINWEKLATGVDTLVFLMGMENLPEIVAKLVENGRDEETPAAIIKEGTRASQRTVTGTLKNIVSRVKKSGLTSPAIILVGDVVKLRESIQWFDNRPLFGKRVLVTRSRQQASALSKLLAEKGAIPVELPAIAIEPIKNNKSLEKAIGNLGKFDWVIFTSVNGVEAVFTQLTKLDLDARAFKGVKIAAIGTATASALKERGIKADYCPGVFTTEGLIAGFKKLKVAGQKFLLPRTDIADEQLTEGLEGLGASAEEIAVYRTRPDNEAIAGVKEKLLAHEIDVITFASSSTVTNLVNAFDEGIQIHGIKIACIGPKTADTATKAGLKPDIVARVSTIPGMVEAIEEFYRKGE